jgi:VanZ family protein
MPSASYLLTNSSQPAPTPNLRRWFRNHPANAVTLLTWLPVALFLGIFAMESTRAFGSDHTSAPLQHFFQSIFGSAINHNWSYLHHLIRKTGHFTAYGTFSLFAYQAAARTLNSRVGDKLQRQQLSHILALAATLVAASADEIHQCFLPNRTGCLADVLLDTAGAFTIQLSLVVLLHFIAQKTKARGDSPTAYELHPEPAIAT